MKYNNIKYRHISWSKVVRSVPIDGKRLYKVDQKWF